MKRSHKRQARYPTPESVVAEIQRRRREGMPVHGGAVQCGPTRDGALASSGRKFFSSWHELLEKAGVPLSQLPHRSRPHRRPRKGRSVPPPRKPRRPPSGPPNVPAGIVREIRELHRRSAPLNLSAMKRHHPELLAAVYRLRPFVGWRQALAVAGINYAGINTELLDYVVCPICGKDLRVLNAHLRQIHETNLAEVREEYPDLQDRSKQFLAETSRMDGGPLPHWEPLWTDEYVLDRIAEYYSRDLPLNAYGVEGTLLVQARKRFGSWELALRAAGIDPLEVQLVVERTEFSTKRELIRAIRQRVRAGERINERYLTVIAKNPLYRRLRDQGLRFFGTWRAALEAAGLDPDDFISPQGNRYRKPESVLEEIRRRHRKGLPLNTEALTKRPARDAPFRDGSLYNHGKNYFGSWEEALRQAGLDPDQIIRQRNSNAFSTVGEVVQAILGRLRCAQPLNLLALNNEGPRGRRLYYQGVQLFGSWRAALAAAGLEPEKHNGRLPSPYNDPDVLLAEIRRRHREGLTLYPTAVLRGPSSDPGLRRKAKQHFGSWEEAICRAGVAYTPNPNTRPGRGQSRYPNPKAVLKEIRRRHKCGLPVDALSLRTRDCRPTNDHALHHKGVEYFGSWKKALEAAGVSLQPKR